MYRVRDCQFEDKYFGNGSIFNTKKEICEQLISYHSNDCNMSVENKLLHKGKIKECIEALCQFEWEVEQITCEQCGSKKL